MKKHNLLYALLLIPVLQGCEANQQTGQMEPGWLFWVFLGLLLGILFIGALANFLKKKRPEGTPTKAEQEMEAYEETLQHKLEKEEKENQRLEKEESDNDTKKEDKKNNYSKEK